MVALRCVALFLASLKQGIQQGQSQSYTVGRYSTGSSKIPGEEAGLGMNAQSETSSKKCCTSISYRFEVLVVN